MDASKYGSFSEPGYISIGDEYEKKRKDTKNDRTKGKQFSTSVVKKGKTNDAFFSKFESLHIGDAYHDSGYFERLERKKQAKLNIGSVFRPSSPPKRSSGSGDYFGTLGTKYDHQADQTVQKKGEPPSKKPTEPKNFITSPPKKGTFGVPGTTLGKEPEYKADPYDSAKQKQLEEKKAEEKKKVSSKPFNSMGRRMDSFDGNKVYSNEGITIKEKKEPKKEKFTGTPFRPSSPPKKGYNSTLERFPEYKPDPYDEREKREREMKKKEKPPVPFRPVSSPKSKPTRSVVFH